MKKKKKTKSGTGEWATKDKDLYYGCVNNCRYCYARRTYTVRLRKVTKKTLENWTEMIFREKNFNEKPKKVDGRLFCFAHHDMDENNIDVCIEYMKKWLEEGNEILIVTKPRIFCIKKICKELEQYKSQITFRFTIGSTVNEVLKFWERDAPTFQERLESLIYAHNSCYKTSVSCEPYLDATIDTLVEIVEDYVTDSIWIGKMNKIDERLDRTDWGEKGDRYLEVVMKFQTDDEVRRLYKKFKDNPKVKWKDSMRQVLGLPEQEVG